MEGKLYNFIENQILRIDYRTKLRTLGSSYGSFTIAPKYLPKNPIVYSFGVGEDISFDLELLKRGARVYAFDPTPKSIEWLEKQKLPKEFYFSPEGLSDIEEKVNFFLPRNPEYVSASIVHHNGTGKKITVQMQTLKNCMRRYGHSYIDLLKMDIEGSEFKVIDSFCKENILVREICIEIHNRFYEDGLFRLLKMRMQLRMHHYLLVSVSDDLQELTFIRKGANKT